MAIIEFNVNLYDSVPFLRAGCAGLGLWVRLVCYAVRHHTDQVVPAAVVDRYASSPDLIRQLVALQLLERHKGGYRIVNATLPANGKPYFRVKVPQARGNIPAETRLAVYVRDGHRCVECGCADDLTLDHVHPWSLGGPDTEDNLRVLCRSCNSRKGARTA